ncbi:HAD-IIA family hydrolase [Bailinhaonella thermotolerans]|uniref:HAD-IIA family hydrolase n=1 Tax=Bailinhaonella thermotolerans TaxID=1070861 RepID=A0A3A4A5K6_9ACTN|nr:HAD-IIA family hydrolase [Bailinhaonella thermotolerans]RJL20703.1 HAD-IIA family hydrolase [Bailinhaonella thermotolerans]
MAGERPGVAERPRGSRGALLDDYDALLLDLDGVVYLGRAAVPGAADSLGKAREHGVRLAYVTNNASRTPGAIAEHLTSLGIPATGDDVVTSAQAAARLIAERVPAGSPVLVVGGTGLRWALRAHGLRPVSAAAERPAAVVQGIAPDLSYALMSEGAIAVREGALFVAANADSTMPTGRGEVPGNGAMIQVIRTATGVDPIVAGKPMRPLHREAIIRTGSSRPLVVGDRLDTDIEGANNAGADSLLVLTGVARPADLLTAPPEHRPTHIADDLSGLLVPHEPVTLDGDCAACAGWTARWTGGHLELHGSGTRSDALRAACAAAWSAAAEGRLTPDQVAPALSALPPATPPSP